MIIRRYLMGTLAGAAVLAMGMGCSSDTGDADKPAESTTSDNKVAMNAPMAATPTAEPSEGQVGEAKSDTTLPDAEKPEAPPETKMGSPEAAPGPGLRTGPPPRPQPGGGGGGQNRGFGGGRGGGMAFMLANDSLRKEIGLTDDQVKKFEALMPARGAGAPPGGPNAGGAEMSREERQKQREELQAKIEGILTAPQKKRIQEIQYQMMGFRAFSNPDVVKELGITAEQTKKFEELMPQRGGPSAGGSGGDAPRGGAPGGGPGTGGPGGGDMSPEERAKRRAERMNEFMAVLTPAQKAKWEKMTGKPFQMQFEMRGNNRGGGGGGGRGA